MNNETRSFIVGIAIDCGIEAALIYDDLAFAQRSVGYGEWFFRSYEQLLNRLPFMSERTARTAIRKLEAAELISTQVKKDKMGVTKCHYRLGTALLAERERQKLPNGQSAKIAEPINKQLKEATKEDFSLVHQKELLAAIVVIVNPKEKVTDDRLRLLRGRLKDYTPDEIENAARALSKSQWHKDNKRMSVDNLLAPSKFGNWYAQSNKAESGVNNGAGTRTAEQNNRDSLDAAKAFRLAAGGEY